MTRSESHRIWRSAADYVVGGAVLILITAIGLWLALDVATVAFAFLIAIALGALRARFRSLAILAVMAAALLDYCFAPPVFDFRIARPQDALVIFAFLAAAVTVAGLVALRRRRTEGVPPSLPMIAAAFAEKDKAEEDLRLAIDTLPALVWSTRADGANDFCNQRWLSYTNLPLEQSHGLGWAATFHPDDLPGHLEKWRRSVASGEPLENEARLRRFDGTYRWFLFRAEALRDENGRIIKWYGTNTDIEDRKRTEAALRRSEAYLAEAQRLSSTGSFGWKPASGEIFWSEETFRIFGWERTRPLTLDGILDRIHPDDRDGVRHILDESSRERRNFDLIHRLVMPNGSIKYIHAIGHATNDESGELEFVGALMDITAAKLTESALRENEQRFRDFSEAASDWHWESDRDHRFTSIGEGSLTLARFGLEVDSAIGKRRWEIAGDVEAEPEKWREHIATVDAHQPFRRFIYAITPPSGPPVYISANGKPRFDASGNFLGYRGVNTDVTAAVRAAQAEEALHQVQAELAHVGRVSLLGELTASIAHEVNQPLAAIVTNGEAGLRWLAREKPEIEVAQRSFRRIIGDAGRASEVIRRIRDLAKKSSPEKKSIDINDLIEEVIPLVQREAARHEVAIELDLAPGLPPVLGDRIQLQQVVINLVINAIEAIASISGGQRDLVIHSMREGEDQVAVAVVDSGPGMQPETMERLFQAFFTTKEKGMGLGLSICNSIIEAHGGQIWPTRNEGRGTTFRFTLPRHRELVV